MVPGALLAHPLACAGSHTSCCAFQVQMLEARFGRSIVSRLITSRMWLQDPSRATVKQNGQCMFVTLQAISHLGTHLYNHSVLVLGLVTSVGEDMQLYCVTHVKLWYKQCVTACRPFSGPPDGG